MIKTLLKSSGGLGWCALVLVLAWPAAAQEGDPSAGAPELPPQQIRIIDPAGDLVAPAPATEVQQYCLNIADKAQDARYSLQESRMKDLEVAISQKIDELEAKRADYETWLAERQRFLDSASQIVVDIYSQMKAVAAAPQLANLDRDAAASVLVRLKSRQASDILSEMSPAVAAEIAKRIVDKTSAGTAADAEQVAESRS
ncbi:MotE family protein [Aurantimonas sp. HBX-1]|uniref:MotE family protein n=1 Tax=Aurantimonas sp. HBX-1 TaxID=2906072 RepID=UPI001F47F114|nr:MotE family protein [Aurantimonas sp. HBX-1]UIJ72869.1 MotE family protein [Aurantimonas sp. HBX-1]